MSEQDPLSALPLRQRRFVQFFTGAAEGVGSRAAEMAGYSPTKSSNGFEAAAYRLLHNPRIRAAIDHIAGQDPLLASGAQRRAWLAKVVNEKRGEVRDQVRAMELLQKSSGDFVTKVQVEGSIEHRQSKPIDFAAFTTEELAEYQRCMAVADQIVEQVYARKTALLGTGVIEADFETVNEDDPA